MEEKKIQIIKCQCNKVVAACVEPYCYTDKDWKESLRISVNKGRKVEMKPSGEGIKIEGCTCNEVNKKNSTQASIF